MAHFDPIKVPLQGNNIVEASAGTGKTFSIGLLVLRLLIEKKLPINKILMVTFTNAAVAELAARIRLFITKAINIAEGGDIKEEDIRTIVNRFKDEETISLLKRALSDLDEASIQTIHSFCQEALNTYALSSGQTFDLELQPDVLEVANDEIRNFWRKNITGLPEELLRETEQISFENFEAAVKETIGGKKYAFYYEEDFEIKEFGKRFSSFWNAYNQKKTEIVNDIQDVDHKDIKYLQERYKNNMVAHAAHFGGYFDILTSNTNYKNNLSDHLFAEDKKIACELLSEKEACCHWLFSVCIQKVTERVQKYLKENHLITYDNLITQMHKAVVDENKDDFQNALREKYEAVFIDEFQDTDKLQYEIYNELFGKDKTLFYIGDPKQSIYAWRKADLHTYFQAKKNIPVERHYEMDKNYRSSPAYIKAVEEFYSRCDDPFNTGKGGLDLRYLPVTAHNKLAEGLKKESGVLNALQVFDGETKGKIKGKVPKLVCEILNGGYKLNGKKVKNSDIGILVRTNNEADQVKGLLAGAGIHAITIDDNQVFRDSQEAKSLRYILQAVMDTSESNINKALLNSFTGYDAKEVAEINKEDLLDVFRVYREMWYRSGVYPMIREYMNDFGIMRNLLETSDANGLRILTDLTQILELLQEVEYRQELKPLGLYEYLGKQIAGELQEGDDYQQRIESDEAAVKIVTVHKAKGLEYPIVIAPYLDLKAKEENFFQTYAYREEEAGGEYKFYCKKLRDQDQKDLFINQLEQENRRLLYVALTRAKYNCFLFKTTGRGSTNTCLSPFVDNFDGFACLEQPLPSREDHEDQEESKLPEYWGVTQTPEKFKLADKLYGNLSFSGISAHGAYIPKENNGDPTGYDQFIFNDIPRGTVIGDMLHLLFENIDFTGSEDHHREELEKLLDRFYPHKKEEYREGLFIMINHVLKADIEVKGQKISLKEIANSSMKNEMEFDLRTQGVDLVGLNNFEAGDGIELGCITQHPAKSGLLTGFIDLLFKHDDKFYILDWKSNYLGDDLNYYDGEDKMKSAMNEGNYHLQYLIYSVAVKKYLEQRIPDFNYEKHFGGVIYIFLRGAREEKQTGIYTNRPTLDQVEKLESLFCKKEPAA